MTSSSTSARARACSRGRCSRPAPVWSRSSVTSSSRPRYGLGSVATSRSSRPTSSIGAFPNRPFAVVANLPFAGSGAILSRLLRGPVTRAVVIVEWAFAQKQAAVWPTTLKSAYWRAFGELELARRLDREDSPRTASERRRGGPVLHAPRPAASCPSADYQPYWQFLSDAFHAGTEVERGVLTPLQAKRLAPTLGFARHARPRELDARQSAGVLRAVRRVPTIGIIHSRRPRPTTRFTRVPARRRRPALGRWASTMPLRLARDLARCTCPTRQ